MATANATILENANFHAIPGGQIIGFLAKGDRVTVITEVQHEKHWLRVETKAGVNGWVIADAVERSSFYAPGREDDFPQAIRPAGVGPKLDDVAFGDDVAPSDRKPEPPAPSLPLEVRWWAGLPASGWAVVGIVIAIIVGVLWVLQ